MSAPTGIDWDWAVRTGGVLNPRQKVQLLAPLLSVITRYPAIRWRLATGRRGLAHLNLDAFSWPDSQLARDAEAEAREVLSPHVLQHSYRTYLFGCVLASIDAVTIDHEIAYVSSMLHDTHLEHPTPGRCFAVVGAEHAERFALRRGVDPDRATAIGAAIAGHLTLGAERDLSTGLVSAGALLDISGYRLDEIDPAWVDELHSRYPRHDLRRHLLGALADEQTAVPSGRVDWLTRYAALRLLLRLAPYDE